MNHLEKRERVVFCFVLSCFFLVLVLFFFSFHLVLLALVFRSATDASEWNPSSSSAP